MCVCVNKLLILVCTCCLIKNIFVTFYMNLYLLFDVMFIYVKCLFMYIFI